MIRDEAELAPLEKHLLGGGVNRAKAAEDHVDLMRAVILECEMDGGGM